LAQNNRTQNNRTPKYPTPKYPTPKYPTPKYPTQKAITMNDTPRFGPSGRCPPVQWHATLRDPTNSREWEAVVRGASISEELGQPYHIALELRLAEAVEIASLPGLELELSWCREERLRVLHAVVLEVTLLGSDAEGLELEVVAGPALALLARGTRSRILQDLDVVEVAQQLVAEVLGPRGVQLDTSRLGTYERRDYWVQYRESDLAFFQRILEREGITFHIVDDGDREIVRMVDSNATMDALGDGESQLGIAQRSDLAAEEEAIHGFAPAHRLRPARTRVVERDWRTFGEGELTFADVQDGGGDPRLYDYVHDVAGRHDADAAAAGPDLAPARASLHHERIIANARSFRARSDAVLIAPGRIVEVFGHPDPGVDGRYVVTAARHRGHAPDPLRDAGSLRHDYTNDWVCLPEEVEYRAPRSTRVPRILGVHTATVTGPSTEEIHTDAYGRIRVRMHWDQDAHFRGDGSAPSCWLRVAQTWAGAGFGTLFIPRVGMEVLVTFIDGDPERPLCIGCVYNGNNPAPRSLPDERTRSVIRTRSSPGGNGFNELSFEDSAGHEQVYLHAQRNLDEVVRANHSEQVGVDDTCSVGRDRTTTIDRHETHRVGGDRFREVGGSEGVHVMGSQHVVVFGGAGAGTEVGAPTPPGADLFVHGTYTLDVRDKIVLRCGGSSIELTPTSISMQAVNLMTMGVAASQVDLLPASITQRSPIVAISGHTAGLVLSTECSIQSPEKIKLTVDKSKLTLDPVSTRLRSTIATITGSSALDLASDLMASMRAPSVGVHGTTTAHVTGEASTTIEGGEAKVVLAQGAVAINDV